MKVICYFDRKDEQGERLERVVEMFLSKEKLLMCRNLDTLREKLRQPYHYNDVLLVSPPDRAGLTELIALRDWLRDMRIILVLPDREKDTIAMGHLLRPRMISYSDSDFLDVTSVLVRMMEKTTVKSA